MERKCGILLALSSLPGPFGIGTMGKQAYRFIDQLKEAGQSYWQVLPLSPVGAGNSPYQSVSAFAGSPDFIDFGLLEEDGLLTREETEQYRKDFIHDAEYADFDTLRKTRLDALYPAYLRGKEKYAREIRDFSWENSHWLHDYALYMAFAERFGSCMFSSWPQPLRDRESAALMQAARENRERVGFHIFCQFLFWRQWDALKRYANENGVKLIGDMPFYVSGDSADRWANRACFDRDGLTAGCPPDYFAPEGQLWGNPLFDWDYMEKDGYSWWVARIQYLCNVYDMLRIDHFRGFDSYFAIPYGDANAQRGHWKQGPGMDLFSTVEQKIGKQNIMAEDLGYMTDSVKKLLSDSGFPGIKLLQFAFDSRDGGGDMYLPENYPENCVAYTGTHDNDTSVGWVTSAEPEDVKQAFRYLHTDTAEDINWKMMRAIWESAAGLTIVQAQDLLGLGSWSRMNTPSTVGKNWKWRALKGSFTSELSEKIRNEIKIYGRCR